MNAMNSNELDQTYLLQSYNENNSAWLNTNNNQWPSKNNQIKNNKSKKNACKVQKLSNNILKCEKFVNSQKINELQIIHQQSYILPQTTLFDIDNCQNLSKLNQILYDSINDNDQVEAFQNKSENKDLSFQYLKQYPELQQQMKKYCNKQILITLGNKIKNTQQYIINLTYCYKQAINQIQKRNQTIYEMEDLILSQSKCINSFQAQLKYIEKRLEESDKSIARILDQKKLKDTFQGQNYIHEQISDILSKKVAQCHQKIGLFLSKQKQKQKQKQKPKQKQKSKQKQKQKVDKRDNIQKCRKHKTEYILENSQLNQCQSMMAKFINKQTKQSDHLLPGDQNNPYLSNQLHPNNSHHQKCQPNNSKHIHNPKYNQNWQSSSSSNNYSTIKHSITSQASQSRNISVYPHTQFILSIDQNAEKIQNYRLLTNFRIKQLIKQNQSLKNQLSSLQAKSIILRKQNNQFQNIIENLIHEIKNQYQSEY